MAEYSLSHLQELEAESIHIIREVAARRRHSREILSSCGVSCAARAGMVSIVGAASTLSIALTYSAWLSRSNCVRGLADESEPKAI